jgi:hypothetical protein
MFLWQSWAEPPRDFAWRGVPVKPENRDPARLAMVDFCHLLFNTSEFLYLH